MNASWWTGVDQLVPAFEVAVPGLLTGTVYTGTPPNLTTADATFVECNSVVGGDVTSVSPNQTYLDDTTNINSEAGYNTGTSVPTCNWNSGAVTTAIAVRVRASISHPGPGGCQLPCVQSTSGSLILSEIDGVGSSVPAFTSISTGFAQPVKANNLVALTCTYPSAGAITSISEDSGSDSFATVTENDTTNTQKISTSYGIVAGGARIFTANFSGSGLLHGKCHAQEFYHVAATPFDTSSANFATSATLTAGSLTPAQSGDLLLHCTFRDVNQNTTSWGVGSQANITWHMLNPDNLDGMVCQYGVYSSTSAINPTMTSYDSQAFVSLGTAFKSDASKGSGPNSGIVIANVQSEDLPSLIGPSTNGFVQYQVLAFPCSGNLLAFEWVTGSATATPTIATVQDNNGNAWTISATTALDSSFVQQVYATNATCSDDELLKIRWTDASFISGTPADNGTLKIFDIQGAATVPFDTVSSAATGDQAVGGNLTMASLTTAGANELVIFGGGVDFNTFANMVGAGYSGITNTYGGQNPSGPSPMDENNPFGVYYNSTASTATAVFAPLFGTGTAAGHWAGLAMAFKAANTPHAHGHAIMF
jgi:hypothetical protein